MTMLPTLQHSGQDELQTKEKQVGISECLFSLFFKVSPGAQASFHMKTSFHPSANQTFFYVHGILQLYIAPALALKKWRRTTRKWANACINKRESNVLNLLITMVQYFEASSKSYFNPLDSLSIKSFAFSFDKTVPFGRETNDSTGNLQKSMK